MKEQIHTIPVTDALKQPNNCAFCAMNEKLESDAIQFILGPAYMEDDVRLDTNKTGFCKRHMDAMYEAQNRLGLALMLHTHLQQLNSDANKISTMKKQVKLFGKDPDSVIARLGRHFNNVQEACYVCDKVESTFLRYIDTFLYIWDKGKDGAELIKEQKGYCMPHFAQLLTAAAKLGRGKQEKFAEEILSSQLKYMKELETDLDWFTQKFDFRNADAPWGNSKDALPRVLAFLTGGGVE